MIGEILELDHDAGEGLARRGDEFVDELVIGGTAQAPLAHADIVGVVQQRLVVGADIQHHRQAELRMDAGAGGIERQLADRNTHAVGAEVAEAEDALAVGDDDEFGRVGPVAQKFGDAAAVAGCNEQAARPLEDVAEPLAGEADRRRCRSAAGFHRCCRTRRGRTAPRCGRAARSAPHIWRGRSASRVNWPARARPGPPSKVRARAGSRAIPARRAPAR